jgi:GNAT superfamily N-acetyltransferase
MPSTLSIREHPLSALRGYGRIPIAFEVRSMLDCSPVDSGLGGIALAERPVETPYVKDYDAIAGNGPERWLARFDTARWGLLLAEEGGTPVGGTVIAYDAADVEMLEGRRDLAVLWDLRVAPEHRGRGLGTALFDAARTWAAERHCAMLKIETQNVNVAACRFYARRGCTLGAIHRFAYPDLPEEAQLLWYLVLRPARPLPRVLAPPG